MEGRLETKNTCVKGDRCEDNEELRRSPVLTLPSHLTTSVIKLKTPIHDSLKLFLLTP